MHVRRPPTAPLRPGAVPTGYQWGRWERITYPQAYPQVYAQGYEQFIHTLSTHYEQAMHRLCTGHTQTINSIINRLSTYICMLMRVIKAGIDCHCQRI